MAKSKVDPIPSTSAVLPHLLLPLRFRLFHAERHPTKAEVQVVFASLRDRGMELLGDPIVGRQKVIDGRKVRYSLAMFRYQARPPFLAANAPQPLQQGLRERRIGYVIIVSNGSFVATSCTGTSWREGFLEDVARPLTHRRVKQIAGWLANSYEKLSLLNLSISPGVVRNQTLEAEDLAGVVQTLGAGQQAPRVARLRRDDGARWTVTLSSGHISVASPRLRIDGFLSFLDTVFGLAVTVPVAPGRTFLDAFATPLELGELPDGVEPAALLLDLVELREGIAAGELHLEAKGATGEHVPVEDWVARAYIDEFSSSLALRKQGDAYAIEHASPVLDGAVRLVSNKSSYSLGGNLLRGLRVVSKTGGPQGIRAWLRENESLRMTYSRPQYAYLLNQLFEDTELVSHLPTLRQLLQAVPAIDGLKCEKFPGKTKPPGATAFPSNSMFAYVEQAVATSDFVVCDDLGPEWADYVTLDEAGNSVTFWHAKHDKVKSSLSASKLHDVVSQALKNLGHLRGKKEVVDAKKDKWWSGKWEPTAIERRRYCKFASWEELVSRYCSVMAHLQYSPRVVLVVNCLSQVALDGQFDLIENGRAEECEHQVFQLVWLLAVLVSTCRGQGIEPVVQCRP